jgi:hypothetical protein
MTGMYLMKNRIKTILFLSLILLLNAFSSKAQTDTRADFNSAVDQINCETIKFIHREADRGDIADKMQCFTFESTYKTIPEDETKTTGQLSKKIDAFKEKFKPAEDLAQQLDKVIEFASGRIKAKKRKGNVDEFTERLNDIKQEALENTSEPAPETVTAANDTTKKITVAEDEEILPESAKTKDSGSGNWLGWLSLLLSLLSLAIAGFVLFRVRNIIAEADEKISRLESETGNRPVTPLVNESTGNYRLLENKLHEELRKVRQEMNDKIAAVASSAGNSTDTSAAALEEFEFTPKELEPSEEDIDTNIEEEEEPKQPQPQNAEVSSEPEPERTIVSSSLDDAVAGEMLPVYKYAGLPSHQGYFTDDEITEEPQEDSVFEIEMYEDVGDRAFLSVLNYTNVMAKALSEPEKYLDPYCRYEQDPAGKTKVILLEEGLLQRQGNMWIIAEKIRVRFE